MQQTPGAAIVSMAWNGFFGPTEAGTTNSFSPGLRPFVVPPSGGNGHNENCCGRRGLETLWRAAFHPCPGCRRSVKRFGPQPPPRFPSLTHTDLTIHKMYICTDPPPARAGAPPCGCGCPGRKVPFDGEKVPHDGTKVPAPRAIEKEGQRLASPSLTPNTAPARMHSVSASPSTR